MLHFKHKSSAHHGTVSHSMALSSTPLTVISCCVGALLSAAKHGDDSRCVSISSHILAFPSVFRTLMWKGREKKISHSHGPHNVCSSTAPVFNFRTWKTFPSKESGGGQKNPSLFQPVTRSITFVAPFPSFIWPLFRTPAQPPPVPAPLPPSSSRLLCNTRLLRLLCFLCVLTSPAAPLSLLWLPREQLANSSCLLSLLRRSHTGTSLPPLSLPYSIFGLSSSARAASMQLRRSGLWGMTQLIVNDITNGTITMACPSFGETFELARGHSVSAVTDLHSTLL